MNADFFRVSSAFIPKSAPSASSFSVLLRTFVEHALGLADLGTRDGVEFHHGDLGRYADDGLDAVLQFLADGLDVGGRQFAGQLALEFAAHFQVVEVAVAGDDDLVVAGQALVAQDLLLDLGREDVHAADDQHVVGTAGDLADAAHRDRVRVIPLGIDEGSYPQRGDDGVLQRLGLDEGEPFFLFIGVLRYYKGLHTLVQATASVNAKVVIAGTGPEHVVLQAQVRKLGLQNVVFAGQISDAAKVALLQRCRAFVLPSHLRSEAFGMVLVEASMYGKPMVSCEIGTGTSFVNLEGETGFVVPPESPEALAHAINTLLGDGALAEKFGCAARRRYEALFSGPALGKAYTQLYQDVLKNRP